MEDHIGIRVPLSLGSSKPGFDKKGGICTIFDVIFNTQVA
jgi:hypothetical protein